MRQLANLIINGTILLAATTFFPKYVQIEDSTVLLTATVFLWLLSILIEWLGILAISVGFIFLNIPLIILSILTIFLSDIIALTILSSQLEGFTIVGFVPMICISIISSLLTIKTPQSE